MVSIPMKIFAATAAISCATSPLAAQDTVRAFIGQGQTEARAMLNLAIPFGGQREESKPRFELKLQNFSPQRDVVLQSFVPFDDRISRENRIGFTLTKEPTLMFNGRKFEPVDGQQNLSTGAGIAIAAGIGAGLMLIVVSDTRDALSDAFGEPD